MKPMATTPAATTGVPIERLTDVQLLAKIQDLIYDRELSQLLILAVKDDGGTLSADNGLSIDESLELISRYREWLESAMRRIM